MTKSQVLNLLVRIGLGIIFIAHGMAKLDMGLANVAGFFSSLGLPGFLAYIVTYLEILGGIALIIGLGTRYVSIAFILLMAGAIFKVKLANGLLGSETGAGYELDLALLLLSLYLAVEGAGKLSVDHWIRTRLMKSTSSQA